MSGKIVSRSLISVVWFSLFSFTYSSEAILCTYWNSMFQQVDVLLLDDSYIGSGSS